MAGHYSNKGKDMKVQTVCVLGGTGFVGRHLIARLYNEGFRVKVLTRHRERRHRELLVMPTVELVEAEVRDPAVLAREFEGIDAVINLIGILNEEGSQRFADVHARLPGTVADACRQAGVRRLLHMSALNADAVNGASDYLKTKGAGEDAAHAAADGLQVTSFRPSVIFGPGDSFFNRFAGLLRLAPVLPLACPNARFQPVYVGDVADAFVRSLDGARTVGQRLELGGPRTYTLKELVEYTARLLGRHRIVLGLPDGLSRLQAQIFDKLPGKLLSLDNYRSLQVDSVVTGTDGFALLGIAPHSVEGIVPATLAGQSSRGRYTEFRGAARR